MKLGKKEMLEINGGAISGNLLNYVIKGFNTLLDLGRSLGSAIRRLTSNNLCKI